MHVLVGFDESRQAAAALEHALTRYPDARITVLHVNDPMEWLSADADDEGEVFYSDRALEEVEASGKRALEAARSIAAENDREIDAELLTGRPAREIVGYAEDHDVDHVVVGRHGRRGLARFLLGSVSEHVVERSPVSVTVVRIPPEDG